MLGIDEMIFNVLVSNAVEGIGEYSSLGLLTQEVNKYPFGISGSLSSTLSSPW